MPVTAENILPTFQKYLHTAHIPTLSERIVALLACRDVDYSALVTLITSLVSKITPIERELILTRIGWPQVDTHQTLLALNIDLTVLERRNLLVKLDPAKLIGLLARDNPHLRNFSSGERFIVASRLAPHDLLELCRANIFDMVELAEIMIVKCAHNRQFLTELYEYMPTNNGRIAQLFYISGLTSSNLDTAHTDHIVADEARYRQVYTKSLSAPWTRKEQRQQIFPPYKPGFFAPPLPFNSPEYNKLPQAIKQEIASLALSSASRVPRTWLGNLTILTSNLHTIPKLTPIEALEIAKRASDTDFEATLILIQSLLKYSGGLSLALRRLAILRLPSLSSLITHSFLADSRTWEWIRKRQLEGIAMSIIPDGADKYTYLTNKERTYIIWRMKHDPDPQLLAHLVKFEPLTSIETAQILVRCGDTFLTHLLSNPNPNLPLKTHDKELIHQLLSPYSALDYLIMAAPSLSPQDKYTLLVRSTCQARFVHQIGRIANLDGDSEYLLKLANLLPNPAQIASAPTPTSTPNWLTRLFS